MSETVFYYEKIATNTVQVMLMFIVLFVIVFFIKSALIKILEKKKTRQEKILEEADKLVNEKIDHILKIQNNSNDEGFKESLIKEILRNEEDNELFKIEQNNKISKLDKGIKIVGKLEYLKLLFSIGIIGAFCVIISIVPKISGSISSLNKIDYENQNIKINAYCTVSYSGTDQITLTLYIKNNSDKALRSASLIQKETGSTAKITNLDSGEEKIVSLNSYKGDKYEFEIQEIVFNE